MKLRVLAAGTRLPDWVNEACADYAKRFGSQLKFELLEIPVSARGANADIARAIAREGEKMLGAVRAGDFVVALEVGGKTLSTAEVALWLSARLQEGRDLVFLIGGPDGLASACVERANLRLSLSALTLPHGLARVLLIEQLYRAFTFGKGHPYHRA
jgi:23S rRNA (pseudouridine1915-N3)-methyltransferase